MQRAIAAGLCAATLTLLAGCAGTGEQEEQEPLFDLSQFDSDEGERCIPLMGIKSTKILGNQAIEFRMRGGVTYLNVLPRPCHALSRDRILSWETSMNQLCNLDILKVLDRAGPGLQMVGACGLGYFHPLPEGVLPVPQDDE